MTRARFIHCPECGRLMLGQVSNDATYPQPHRCEPDTTTERPA